MRTTLLIIITHILTLSASAQNNVGIGTSSPSPNALLHLDNGASDLGLLLPNADHTTFSPLGTDIGMMIYDDNEDKVYIWDGSNWISSTSEWGVNGNDIFNLNSGNVGIGTNTPSEKLTVVDNVFGAIASLNSSGGNTLMDFINTGANPANWRFGYLGNTGGNPGYMTFLRGSHRFVVTNNGDIGIAETNPQARLEINSSGNSNASHALLINNSNPSNLFSVRDDGNVGIGTITPSSTLHVVGSGLMTGRLELTGTNDANGIAGSGVLEIGGALRIDPNEIITNSNTPLSLQNDNNGDLIVDNGSFVVDASLNNIGIGTLSPLEKMHLFDASDPTIRLSSSATATFSNAVNSGSIQLLEASADPGAGAYGGGVTYDGSANLLKLQTYNNAAVNDAILISRNTGNVGIKTSGNPVAELDVNGSIRVQNEVNRPSTGGANLVPICYGNVSAAGVIEAGSGNYSVSKPSTGRYDITITGETYFFSNYIAIVTPIGTGIETGTSSVGGNLLIYTRSSAGNAVDSRFQFVVYKP